MTQKGILILISGLLLTGCLTGCNTGSANAAEQVSQQAGTSSLSAAAAPEEASLGSENSGAETSVPVFDFEKKTVFLNSGYEMPVAGLGTYALSDEECYNSVTALLENGGRLIDTASYYGNEESIGRAIRDSDVPREEIFVTTKIYPTEFDNPEEAIEGCLERLDIGYIDLMLLHHPASNDTAAYKAIEKAIQEGKVHTAGISCYYIRETDSFLPKVSLKPELIQNEIHPFYQDSKVVEHIQKKEITVQSWYPLGGRGHTGAMFRSPVLQKIAAAHGKSAAQVILRWNLQRGVCVIPGSSNPEHIWENISIFDFALTNAEMEAIAGLDRNEKHDWY